MTARTTLTASTTAANHDFDLFGDLAPLDPFDVKKDEIATHLAALLAFAGKTRSELANEMGWKRSRISTLLSGRNNPTVKTILQVVTKIGFDFDIIFRGPTEKRPLQPWQKEQRTVVLELPRHTSDRTAPLIEIQTAHQVANDLMSGRAKSHYFSLCDNTSTLNSITIDATPQPELLTVIPTTSINMAVPMKKESR